MPTVPEGYATVTPWFIVKDAPAFLEFLTAAFAAQELGRILNADGTIGHAEARIGDAVVMAFEAREGWPATPQFMRLYVDDAKAVLARALAAGGRTVTEVTELPFGDQVGRFADPWDNVWWVQESLEDVPFDDMLRRMEAPHYIEAMRYVQESFDAEMRRRGAG
jgi:uncharacterized glyoxalase superfamily protein PhnB